MVLYRLVQTGIVPHTYDSPDDSLADKKYTPVILYFLICLYVVGKEKCAHTFL